MKKCSTLDLDLKMKVNVKMILFIRNCVYLWIPSLKGVHFTIYYKHYYGNKLLSKVYSKSLLKVGSLKGSVVYSLILNYQFFTSVMRTSGVPQLEVIHMECLYMVISNTSSMIDRLPLLY